MPRSTTSTIVRLAPRNRRGGVAIAGVLLAAAALAAACAAPPADAPAPEGPSAGDPPLWGLQMTPVVPVTEFMRDLLQPAADTLFTSVRVVVDRDGETELGPETDEDWAKLRTAAVTIAESVFLLKIPRPIAPEPDRDRHETELTAAEVLEKLEADTVLWDARIQAVRNVALQAIDVVERRDTEELWDVGANLYQACQNCHYDYWYPEQRDLLVELEEKTRQFRAETGVAEP